VHVSVVDVGPDSSTISQLIEVQPASQVILIFSGSSSFLHVNKMKNNARKVIEIMIDFGFKHFFIVFIFYD
jgi:hypothetical protein